MTNNKFKILVVDDTPKNIQLVASVLKNEGYKLGFATDGKKALESLKTNKFNLILLDVMMPNLDGYETCKIIKQDPSLKDIPVVFLTAKADNESIIKGFELGAVDYLTKPFNKAELLARIKTHLELKDLQDNLKAKVEIGLKVVKALNNEIIETQKEVIFTMGAIGETRSKETGNHVKRVAEYSRLLALYYGLSIEDANMLKQASPMHDIGKVGIPDSILNKPGKLNEDEWKIMQNHAAMGHDMLKHSSRKILKTAAIVALDHHEKYDGTGYPNGKSMEEIHIYGRITALADVFDALGSDRCYKEAWDDKKIFNFIKEERGKHFDPKLVDIFFDNLNEFLEIRDELKDCII